MTDIENKEVGQTQEDNQEYNQQIQAEYDEQRKIVHDNNIAWIRNVNLTIVKGKYVHCSMCAKEVFISNLLNSKLKASGKIKRMCDNCLVISKNRRI
jgi:hypothetical protein